MTKIIPIRDLKDTSKISTMCHESNDPVFITKNGYPDMVIMSTEAYDALKTPVRYVIPMHEEFKVAESTLAYQTPVFNIYTLDDIKRILLPILKKFKVRKAILFGSYAKGCATSKSDIDLFVNSGLKGLKFYGLLEEISNNFSCPVDLIDSQEIIKGSQIDQEIKETGITIYG